MKATKVAAVPKPRSRVSLSAPLAAVATKATSEATKVAEDTAGVAMETAGADKAAGVPKSGSTLASALLYPQ